MKIYLVRHGDSLPMGNDDERMLSEQGTQEIEQLAHLISPLHIQVDRLLQSKKKRAQQTATILASCLQVNEPIETRLELDPLAPVDFLIDDLYAHEKDTLLVGHMPFMGKLASTLLTGNEDRNIVLFSTGTMVCLEQIVDREWAVSWMLTPELTLNRKM